ncbi:hypothetical protein KFK09_011076 [Dendrobium nobile]|uniref:Uncharacterized protein n=1 Tax=Dendrobium nobile TaxID=94219 RepID=A0A8T3BDH8_DENNO|nr:hypothetical protein KFK09_011076 [Dendrobium nobile]
MSGWISMLKQKGVVFLGIILHFFFTEVILPTHPEIFTVSMILYFMNHSPTIVRKVYEPIYINQLLVQTNVFNKYCVYCNCAMN